MFNKKSPTKVGIFFKPQTLSSLSNKRFALIFTVMLLILSVFVLAYGGPGGPDFGGGGGDITAYDSTLKIIEVNAKVDGKKDTITNNGEKIGREAKESSDVEFEIEIENIFEKEIKNVDVTVTIKDIDDGDDLDDEDSIFRIAPGESENVDLGFDLPLKVDDGDYDVKIDVEGKDEDNNIHIANWVLTLEVKKERNNVKIIKALVSPSTVSCSRLTSLTVNILNLGREDEEDVKIEIKNEALGINIKEENIDLDTGTDDDAEYEKTFMVDIPDDIEAGTYPIDVKVYYNKDRDTDTGKVNLIVEDCRQIQQKEAVLTESLPPSIQETMGAAKKEQKETSIIFTYKEPLFLFSIIILVILTGLIIFLVGAIIIQLRR